MASRPRQSTTHKSPTVSSLRSRGERRRRRRRRRMRKRILCAIEGTRSSKWLFDWMGRPQIPRKVRRLAERLQETFRRCSRHPKSCHGSNPAKSHGQRASNVMLNKPPLKDRARGRWLGILPALGIGESFLTGKHGPCPLCGGKDRWRWDNLEGRGTWICSKCGGGDGISLVMQKSGWEFREAARQIESPYRIGAGRF